MDINKYQELSGITVPSNRVAVVTAQCRKAQNILESMLGYSLTPAIASENQYDELGISKDLCPFFLQTSNETDNLDPADPVHGAYRLYPYNRSDVNLPIDPVTKIYAVKLVFIRPGSTPNGITHKTFEYGRLNVISRNRVTKYIERDKFRGLWCHCDCEYQCVQMAVDADWLGEDLAALPIDLLDVWADMVTYYTDCKFNVKLEWLASHKVEKWVNEKPEEIANNLKIIKKYAGPNGSVNPVITDTSANRGNPPGLVW